MLDPRRNWRARDSGKRPFTEIGERVIRGNDPLPKSASQRSRATSIRRNRRAFVPVRQAFAEIGEPSFPCYGPSPKSASALFWQTTLRRNRRGCVPGREGPAEICEPVVPVPSKFCPSLPNRSREPISSSRRASKRSFDVPKVFRSATGRLQRAPGMDFKVRDRSRRSAGAYVSLPHRLR